MALALLAVVCIRPTLKKVCCDKHLLEIRVQS